MREDKLQAEVLAYLKKHGPSAPRAIVAAGIGDKMGVRKALRRALQAGRAKTDGWAIASVWSAVDGAPAGGERPIDALEILRAERVRTADRLARLDAAIEALS